MALVPTTTPYLSGGLADTSNAGLDKFIPEVWGDSIKDYMEKALVFGNLATDLSPMVANGGDVIHLPQHTEITAGELYGATADSEALRASAISFTQVSTNEGEYSLTVNQSKYAAVSITDIANTQSSYDVMNIYTKKLGYALAKKIDYYLSLELFKALTYNDGANSAANGALVGNLIDLTGAGDYNIDKTGVANLIRAVHENDSNLEDWTMVLAPATYASLFKLDDFARYDATGSSFGGETPIVSGYAGKLAGVNVVVSNNFVYVVSGESAYTQGTSPVFNSTNITDESDHLAGYMIHKDAINIAYAKGMKARVQSEYDLASLSTRFVADTVYGSVLVGNTGTNKRLFALMDQ
tara:strand:- start:339 stop:1397 length:1059 start_codon:yes stop_codon:yes gene_type:complete